MLNFHTSVPQALKHPSVWAGIAGAIASVAASTAPPIQTILLSVSGLASVMAIVLKSPDTVTLENQDKAE